MKKDKDAETRLLEAIFNKRKAPAGKPSPEALTRLKEKLEGVLLTLTQREREVIKLRYGFLGDGCIYTRKEIGKMFGVTLERVRQIEAKAVRKLQHPVRKRMVEGLTDAPAPSSSTVNRPENQPPA